jgi:hypothetical protein
MGPLPTSHKPGGQPASRSSSSSSSAPTDSATPARVGHKRPASAMPALLPARPNQQPRGHAPLRTGHALQALATLTPHESSPSGPSPAGPSLALDDEIQPAQQAAAQALQPTQSNVQDFFEEYDAQQADAQQADAQLHGSISSDVHELFADYDDNQQADAAMLALAQAILESPAPQQAPSLPTTPILLGHLQARVNSTPDSSYKSRLNSDLATVTRSIQARLDTLTAQERQDFNVQGIALEGRTLTPLLAQYCLRADKAMAGLGEQDISNLSRAQLMATLIREQLGSVPLVNPQGRLVPRTSGNADTPEVHPLNAQRLGQTVAIKGASPYQKQRAGNAGGHLGRLAVLVVAQHCSLDAVQTAGLHKMITNPAPYDFQLRLHQLGQRHGPLAIALVHQLWDPQWVTAENATTDTVTGEPKSQNAIPITHRSMLLHALMHLPERNAEGIALMPRLIAAAADDIALQALCQEIADTAQPALEKIYEDVPTHLHHALRRLRGLPYTPNSVLPTSVTARGYTGATADDTALLWLQRKAQQPSTG